MPKNETPKNETAKEAPLDESQLIQEMTDAGIPVEQISEEEAINDRAKREKQEATELAQLKNEADQLYDEKTAETISEADALKMAKALDRLSSSQVYDRLDMKRFIQYGAVRKDGVREVAAYCQELAGKVKGIIAAKEFERLGILLSGDHSVVLQTVEGQDKQALVNQLKHEIVDVIIQQLEGK